MQELYVLKAMFYIHLFFCLYSFEDDEWGNIKLKNVSISTFSYIVC